MKVMIKIACALILLLFFSCENKATSGYIDGVLVAGAGVSDSALVGVSVYLSMEQERVGLVFIDTALVDESGVFSFNNLCFGVYKMALDSSLVLEQAPMPILLTEDYPSQSIEFVVESIGR